LFLIPALVAPARNPPGEVTPPEGIIIGSVFIYSKYIILHVSRQLYVNDDSA
jgi:hypothetical protein